MGAAPRLSFDAPGRYGRTLAYAVLLSGLLGCQRKAPGPVECQHLAELARVLRLHGELRFYEHVIGANPAVASAQRVADRLFWPRVAGGCHLSRDTAVELEGAFATGVGDGLAAPFAR